MEKKIKIELSTKQAAFVKNILSQINTPALAPDAEETCAIVKGVYAAIEAGEGKATAENK